MNLKPRVYADNTTKPVVVDVSDLIRHVFVEGTYNDKAMYVDSPRLEENGVYGEIKGPKSRTVKIVFSANHDFESVTSYLDPEHAELMQRVPEGLLNKCLREMHESGELQQLIGLVYL